MRTEFSNRHLGRSRRRRSTLKARRGGFTVFELSVGLLVSTIVIATLSTFMIFTYRTFWREMRQDEVNYRARQLMNTFCADAEQAQSVVYVGTGPYTTPNSATAIPATTKLVVFAEQAYDASGTLWGDYDYVSYGWSQSAQTVIRSCYRYSGTDGTSLRVNSSRVVPAGGNYDAALNVQVHVSSGSVSTSSTGCGGKCAGLWIDSMSSLFQGSPSTINVTDIDEVSLDVTVMALSWNQWESQLLHTDAKMRNWRQT